MNITGIKHVFLCLDECESENFVVIVPSIEDETAEEVTAKVLIQADGTIMKMEIDRWQNNKYATTDEHEQMLKDWYAKQDFQAIYQEQLKKAKEWDEEEERLEKEHEALEKEAGKYEILDSDTKEEALDKSNRWREIKDKMFKLRTEMKNLRKTRPYQV